MGRYPGQPGGDQPGKRPAGRRLWGAGPEYVISSNPDYIFIGGAIWSGDTGGDQMRMGFTIDEALAQERLRGFAGREEWKGLTAVQNGDVYGVDHGSLRNIADYVFTEYMAKCIYPDLFADLDPEAEMHDLYATYLPSSATPGPL